MTIYIVWIGLMLLLFILRQNVRMELSFSKHYDLIELLMLGLLLVLSCCRYNVGTDYVNYATDYMYFQKSIRANEWLHFEPGFMMIVNVLISLGFEAHSLFVVVSIITLVCVFVVFGRESNDVAFSMFLYLSLYFLFNSFNVIRQYMAMAITMVSIKDIYERKLGKFLIKVFCATLFHTTAIVMLPFYFLGNKKIGLFQYLLIFGIVLLLQFAYVPILTLVTSILPQYAMYLKFEGGGAKLSIVFLVLNFLFLYLAHYFSQRDNLIEEKNEKRYYVYMNAAFWGICLMMFSSINTLFSRVGAYFFVFSTLSIPYGVEMVRQDRRTMVTACIILLSLGYCMYHLNGNVGGVVPYMFK